MNSEVVDRPRPPPMSTRTQPSAQAVAKNMVSVYEQIGPLADKVQWAQRQSTAQSLGAGADDDALHQASRAIAAAIDADAAFFDRNAYHNRQHFCEVLLASSFLANLHGLPGADARLLLLAALIHDFVHDGRPARGFRLERRSVERAAPFLAAVAAGAQQRDRLAALVLATEPVDGVRLALAAGRFHASGAAMPKIPESAPELAQLAVDRDLSRLALLLCEADLLPSVGLTHSHAMRVQDRLAREWGQPLSVRDKLAFVDTVLACGVIGDFFRPNALAVRGELALRVDEPAAG